MKAELKRAADLVAFQRREALSRKRLSGDPRNPFRPRYGAELTFAAASQEAETLGYILKLLEKEAARECARRVFPTLDAILDFVVGLGLMALGGLGLAAACVVAGAPDSFTRAAALLGLFLLPLAVAREPAEVPEYTELPRTEQTAPVQPAVKAVYDADRTLRVLDGETVREMTLADYLVGVTVAEMPASFAEEALKAQAVAARTYTLYKLTAGSNHGDTADICTDSTCCQAYIAMEQARANWGAQADAYEKKVRDAVTSTDGEAILYGGIPILAVFHSSSAGLTRAAGQVWQNDLPYLKPVDSPEAKETIPNYYSRVDFTPAALKEKLLAKIPSADLSGDKKSWLKDPIRDSAGSVETVEVGGVTVRGGTVRAALGLRSACFEWELQNGNFVFYVTGYGHGVGLSQYGADAMAESGADYQTILTHYYTGVTVEVFNG